jgi:hypothetical protein
VELSATRVSPEFPAVKIAGTLSALAVRISPFAFTIVGEITEDESNANVTEPEVPPPVKPVPAVTDSMYC